MDIQETVFLWIMREADQVTKKLGNEDYTTMAYMPTWRGQSNHDVNTSEYSRDQSAVTLS